MVLFLILTSVGRDNCGRERHSRSDCASHNDRSSSVVVVVVAVAAEKVIALTVIVEAISVDREIESSALNLSCF